MSHFSISIIKSIIRMIACFILFIATKDLFIGIFSVLFFVAEGLGIAEEIFDKRKE